jgi:hypothetical protein
MADQQRDVIEILEHDHREVEQMFTELESLRGASTQDAKSRRKDLADQVTMRSSPYTGRRRRGWQGGVTRPRRRSGGAQ